MSEEAVKENPMRRIRIAHVVVHSCAGRPSEIERAVKIIEQLTGQRPSIRRAKRTIRGFGIQRGDPIAVMVTLRREKALAFLQRALEAKDYKLPASCFDETGGFAFGFKDQLELPGTKYDPNLGVIGFDVIVRLERPGFRVARRKRRRSKIGRKHRITRKEAIEWVKKELGVRVLDE